jgi:hypothetical protein
MSLPRGRIAALAGAVWLLIAVLAIANGTLREAVLIPTLGNTVAQVVSVLILAAIILLLHWPKGPGKRSDVRPRRSRPQCGGRRHQ